MKITTTTIGMNSKNKNNTCPDLLKDESLRDYIIDNILEKYEADEILIDLLKSDLLQIATEQLENTSTKDLKDLFEEIFPA